jgi:hypothetical protein
MLKRDLVLRPIELEFKRFAALLFQVLEPSV